MGRASVVRGIELLAMAAVLVILADGAARGAWLIQSIALTGTLTVPPAMTFDSQDRAQVVYRAATGGYLQHTYGSSAGSMPVWTVPVSTTISSSYGSGQAYLVPAGNSVYLGYRDGYGYSSSTLRGYASVFDGSTWTNYPLPSSPLFNGPYGMVADGSGQVQWIATSHPTGTPSGIYLYGKSGSTDVYTPMALGAVPSLPYSSGMSLQQGGQAVLDSSGNLHTIQFTDAGSAQLLYAKGPTGRPFTVADNLDAGWQVKLGRPSIAVDAAGNAHIAYTQLWPYYGVKHLNWNGTAWESEWIEQGGNGSGYLGTFPQVLLDKAGTVHVIYADLLNGLLKNAVKGPSGWQIESIDTIGTQEIYGSSAGALAAAVDSRGGIGVAYWNPKDGAMKYAYLVPEPASFALLGAGLFAAVRRRRKVQDGPRAGWH